MKLGIRLESLAMPVRRGLQEASRLGVAGVQVDAVGDLAPDQLSGTGRREFRNVLRSHDLELTALGCPLRRGLDVAENLQPRIEHVRKVMTLAFDLGPRLVIVELPRIPEERKEEEAAPTLSAGGLILGSAPSVTDPARVLREALTDLGAFGDRIGVTLALEVGLDPAETVAEYLKRFDTGALQVNYDPANMILNDRDPVAGLTPLHDRIVHVHAREARRSGPSRSATEVPLGAGDIDWMTFVAVLDTIGYRGPLVVRRDSGTNRAADVGSGVAFLRRFVRPGN